MKRESLVFLLGAIVASVPFLGIPNDMRRIMLVVAGAFLIVLGYQLRRLAFLRSIAQENGERKTDVYVERAATAVYDDAAPAMPAETQADQEVPVMTVRKRRRRVKQVQEV